MKTASLSPSASPHRRFLARLGLSPRMPRLRSLVSVLVIGLIISIPWNLLPLVRPCALSRSSHPAAAAHAANNSAALSLPNPAAPAAPAVPPPPNAPPSTADPPLYHPPLDDLSQQQPEKPKLSKANRHGHAALVGPPSFQSIEAAHYASAFEPLPPSPLLYILKHRTVAAEFSLPVHTCDVFSNTDFMKTSLPFSECDASPATAEAFSSRLFLKDDNEVFNNYSDVHLFFRNEKAYKAHLRSKQSSLIEHLNKDGKQKKIVNLPRQEPANGSNSKNSIAFVDSKEPISISKNPTSFACGVIDSDIPQRYCDSRNLAIRLDGVPANVSQAAGLRVLPVFEGAMEGVCHLNENSWFGKGWGEGAAGWMFEGIKISKPQEQTEIQCHLWVETPLFMVSRWDTTNPYQFHQDALNTFMVYGLLNLSSSEMQTVILDSRKADGPYTAAWSHMFSSSRRLLDIRQLALAAKEIIGSETPSPTLCLRRAVWGIHGGISPMSRFATHKTNCTSALLHNAFSEFMLDRIYAAAAGARSGADTVPAMDLAEHSAKRWLPLPAKTELYGQLHEMSVRALYDAGNVDEAEQLAKSAIVVTYAVRKSSTRHASPAEGAAFSEQLQGIDNSHQVASHVMGVGNGTEPSLLRVLKNENDLIAAMEQAIAEWDAGFHDGPKVLFRAVDFAALSFDDQVAISHGTDVFVGPHGAAFAHLLYLRRLPFAGILELKPPERSVGNFQFHNLAKKMNNMYSYSYVNSDNVDPDQMKNCVSELKNLVSKLREARSNMR
ncbi:hypothetical protein HDU84_001689 [Entophlyctis sp. JEL0112]|nr:hypothetical protein HDU84_001689 [Entophlyctis sp. JEL0112]